MWSKLLKFLLKFFGGNKTVEENRKDKILRTTREQAIKAKAEARNEAAEARKEANRIRLEAWALKRPEAVKSSSEAGQRYGKLGKAGNRIIWHEEVDNCAIFKVPEYISKYWINSITGKPTTRIYCNKDIHEPLLQALKLIHLRGLSTQLKTFDGCFMLRYIRGTSRAFSTHSWALAIDLNAETNKLGSEGDITPELVKCWTDVGWTWGGTFSRKDPMHFSYAWE